MAIFFAELKGNLSIPEQTDLVREYVATLGIDPRCVGPARSRYGTLYFPLRAPGRKRRRNARDRRR